jgi:large subunit ribosomal protein L1
MAKKQSAKQPEVPEGASAEQVASAAVPAKESRQPKEAKASDAKAKPSKASKPKGKAEAGEKPAAEAKPQAPPVQVESAPVAPPGTESTKKKGRRPGHGPRRGKKLRELLRAHQQKLAKDGPIPLPKAISHLKGMKRSKFDETVEIHLSLGIDTSQNDQMVRGSVPLPNGIGKSVRVVVFCQGDNVVKAKDAGADYAGGDDLVKKIQGGWLDFDVALATQDMMGMASRLGKVLGPRGLMPTPKSGTVITAGGDVAAAVKEFKAGKVEYRADKGGNVHAGVGKLSFEDNKLVENITAFVEQIRTAKPAGVKGNYVKSITLSATMSPGIPVSM